MHLIVQDRVTRMQSERIIGSFTQDSVTLTKCAPKILFRQCRKQCSHQKTPTRQDGDSVADVRAADDKRNGGGVVTLTYLPLNMPLVRLLCDVDGLIRS